MRCSVCCITTVLASLASCGSCLTVVLPTRKCVRVQAARRSVSLLASTLCSTPSRPASQPVLALSDYPRPGDEQGARSEVVSTASTHKPFLVGNLYIPKVL